MKLLTKEIKDRIPPLYSQDGKGDEAIVHAKFFTPDSNWTWLATEATAFLKDGSEAPLKDAKEEDIEDVHFFGLVRGFSTELGHFSLREMESARGPLGLKIERDRHFEPQTLAKAKEREGIDP